MGVYVYRITTDYTYQSSIRNREFDNEWLSLEKNGKITIKGSHKKGYAWDGCSPKWKIKDMYFGTPEAVLNYTSRRSKTFYASLIHDAFYQFSKELNPIVGRKEIDSEFLIILESDTFPPKKLYYWAVRLLGWWSWYRFRRPFFKSNNSISQS
tara:strand:- start:1109 stop:1567 length:459 start_codon:yes stop_codon:yes gene_type:complete